MYAGDGTGRLHMWHGSKYLGTVHTGDEDTRYTSVTKDDGAIVVSVASLGTLRCWEQASLCDRASTGSHDADSGVLNEKLSQTTTVSRMLFHPNGQQLVTDHKDCLKIWSIESHKCVRSNPKPSERQFCADEMLWDQKGELLYSLNNTTEFRLSICNMRSGSYVDIPELDGLDVVAVTISPMDNTLHIVTKHEGHCTISIFDPVTQKIEKSIEVTSKNTFQTNHMNVRLTPTGNYLIFMIRCTEKELQIVIDAEKKGNLSASPSYEQAPSYKFAALNLKQPSKELLLCYRQLTRILCLGSSMEILPPNVVLIGRQRVSIQWDIDTGQCDSKLVKGTKTPQYFRPIWIEHDHDWGTICRGPIHSIHRNSAQHRGDREERNIASVVAEGSDDGWCMIYDETGQSVNTNPGKQSNHDGSPVSKNIFFDFI